MKHIYDHPKVIIWTIALLTLFFAAQLPWLALDNDVFKFLPEQSESRLAMEKTEDIFGGDLIMAVGVEPKSGTVLNKSSLEFIQTLTEAIEAIGIADDVLSLSNADYIDGTDEGLVISPLIDDFSGSFASIERLKQRLLAWDSYQNTLISTDFSAAQIIITLSGKITVEQREDFFHQVRDLSLEKAGADFTVHIAGASALSILITENMTTDMIVLLPIVVLVVIIALFLSFHRWSGVLLPLMTVMISTIWTIGLLTLLGNSLSMIGTIIPVLLVAVGSAYGIHIINHYYNELRHIHGEINAETRKAAVFSTLHTVGKPVALAGVTTIAGFASLGFSEVIPMRDFGIFTSVGILTALIVALTLIPAILLLKQTDQDVVGKDDEPIDTSAPRSLLEKSLALYHQSLGRHNIFIIFFMTLVVLWAALSARDLIIDQATIEFFKDDTSVVEADRFIREKFAGTNSLSVIIEGQKSGDGVNPEVLAMMDNLSALLLEKHESVANVTAYSDLIRRINQVMHVESSDTNTSADDDYSGYEPVDSFFSDSAEAVDSFFASDNQEPDSFFGDEQEVTSFFTDEDQQPSSFFADSDETVSSFFDQDDNTASVPKAQINSEKFYSSSAELGQLSSDQLNRLMMQAYALSSNVDLSAAELIEYMQRASNYQGRAFDEIPTNPAKYNLETMEDLQNLISQYLVLAGSESTLADDNLEPKNVRMTLTMNATGNLETDDIIATIEAYIDQHLPEEYSYYYSGQADVEKSLTDLIVGTSQSSILISLALVFVIIWWSFRSFTAGLLGTLPLAVTIIFNYGVMAFFGIKLDMNLAIVGSIAIGVGVDYSIHFLSSYRHHGVQGDTAPEADAVTYKALMSSGKAIIFNAFSVGAGFAVLMFSQFNPIVYLGMIISMTMLVSSFTAMTLLPALLNLIKPKFVFHRG